MQAQDDPSLFLFKLWPKIEENKNLIFTVSGVLLAGVMVFSFVSWHGEQKEIAAGQALTGVLLNQGAAATPQAFAGQLQSLATEHSGTDAALRATLEAAAAYYSAGKYTDAQAEFQKVMDSSADQYFKGTAAFGLAACLEAEGKSQEAFQAYQRAQTYPGGESTDAAKFALGRLSEAAGKLNDALNYYSQVSPNTDMGQEAGMRARAIQIKVQADKPAVSMQPARPATTLTMPTSITPTNRTK